MNNIKNMDLHQIISYLSNYCQNMHITNDDKLNIEYIFKSSLISPNYDNGYFVTYSAMCGNLSMLEILKNNGACMDINDNEPLRISAQNKFNDCALFLFNNCINIDDYDYSASYNNLKLIRDSYNIIHS